MATIRLLWFHAIVKMNPLLCPVGTFQLILMLYSEVTFQKKMGITLGPFAPHVFPSKPETNSFISSHIAG
jgi:hypothetical protein